MLDAEGLCRKANTIRDVYLKVTTVNIEDLVEAAGDVEAHGGGRCYVARLGNLLVCQPALIGEGELELIAILACALRAETWAHLRDVEVSDAHKLILDLCGLLLELLLVG